MMHDLSPDLPPGWQMVDGASRQLRIALSDQTFQKMPETVAVLHKVLSTIDNLVAHYTSKGDKGGAPTSAVSTPTGEEEDAHYVSSDVNMMPPPEKGEETPNGPF